MRRKKERLVNMGGQVFEETSHGLVPMNPYPQDEPEMTIAGFNAAFEAVHTGDLSNVAAMSGPGGIAGQEKRERDKVTKTQQIALDAPWDDLEKLGFKKTGNQPNDVLCEVEFPEGWEMKPSEEDHRSSYLYDPQGRQRGSMFYKAASYDQYANFSLNKRFTYRLVYQDKDMDFSDRHGAPFRGEVEDNVTGKIVFSTPYAKTMSTSSSDKGYWEQKDVLDKEANEMIEAWLNENYSDWKSPLAHWDD